jgi:hypothetical protein
MSKIEDEFQDFKKEINDRQDCFEVDANRDISRGFRTINILLIIITIALAFIGYFCYKGYEKGSDAVVNASVLAYRFNEHERQQRIWENSIIKKEQYCLSTKLLLLKIQQIQAILANDKPEASKIEEEIRQLESKLFIQEIDDVTRGAK